MHRPLCVYSYFYLTVRLNLTPTPREKRIRTRTQTGGESVPKKMRLETPRTQAKKSSVSSSAVGRIHITDVDPDGGYIQIKNMSDEVSTTYIVEPRLPGHLGSRGRPDN